MSRIGKQPITIKPGVNLEITDTHVSVQGPKGALTKAIQPGVKIVADNGEVTVTRVVDSPESRASQGLMRSLIANMVDGVTEGFTKELEIVGVGYRCRLSGANLELSLGFSHPVIIEAPEGIVFEVPSETEIKIWGADKEKVGEIAAKIRSKRKPEPFKGKGVRYKGENVRIKQSKGLE